MTTFVTAVLILNALGFASHTYLLSKDMQGGSLMGLMTTLGFIIWSALLLAQ